MENFVLELNSTDRQLLKDIATDLGHKSDRELINSLVIDFAVKSKQTKCTGKLKKFKNNYPIPPEYNEFYTQFACRNSTTISGAIFRYVIFPVMLERIKQLENIIKSNGQ